MEVIPLRCPRCGTNLTGLSNDIVFQCKRCNETFELMGKRFEPRPVHFAKAKVIRSGPYILLPFWCFDVSYNIRANNNPNAGIFSSLKKISRVFVPAFFQRDIFYFGDIGLIFTQAGLEYQEEKTGHLLLGASRNMKEASVYIRLFILKILDSHADITGIDILPSIDHVSLIGIPFYDLGNKICDGMLGKEFSAGSIDDLNEIREYKDTTESLKQDLFPQ